MRIKRYTIEGQKYSLHIRDARLAGGDVELRYSDNELSDKIGCTVLAADTLDVDELITLYIKNKEIK